MGFPNPLQTGFLESNPEATYQAFVNQWAGRPGYGTRNFLDFWRKQYGNIQNQYQGALAQMPLAGQDPNLPFLDFMKQYNFGNQWAAMAPWDKGLMKQPRGFWNVGGGNARNL